MMGRGVLRGSETWISNTVDWEYSSNLSLMSISSYVVHSTKETGNIHDTAAGLLLYSFLTVLL